MGVWPLGEKDLHLANIPQIILGEESEYPFLEILHLINYVKKNFIMPRDFIAMLGIMMKSHYSSWDSF